MRYGFPLVTETSVTSVEWMSRDCGTDSGALEYLKESAGRFSECYVAIRGFCRYGSRGSKARPRASFVASDSPSAPPDHAWGLFGVVQRYRLLRQLSVDVHRFVGGAVSFDDLRGALFEGSRYVYQYAERINVLLQLLVVVLRIRAPSGVSPHRVVATPADALMRQVGVRGFKMLRRGADARPRSLYAPSLRAWPFNAALGNLVFATVIPRAKRGIVIFPGCVRT